MKNINYTLFKISICLGTLILLISNCSQSKNNDFKIIHLLPYKYEGVMICEWSNVEDTNVTYSEINGDTITVKYNENGIGNLIVDVEGFINSKEEIVYWVDSLDNRMDSVMFINYGVRFNGKRSEYFITRKAKDELTVDRILASVKKERMHNVYPLRLELNNHKLSDTLRFGHKNHKINYFTIDNRLVWLK